MIPQFKNEFVHFKGGRDRLDKTSTPNRPPRHADPILRNTENIVPKSRFKVTLHFGEVEIGSCAGPDEFMGIVEKVETEIENGASDGFAIHHKMFFVEMPTSGARTR